MAVRRPRLRAAARGLRRAFPVAALVTTAALVAGVVTGAVPFEPVRVPSDSMAPTLQAGDQLLLDRRPAPVRRGDLVVVPDPDAPAGEAALLVKRVVAVGGESVALASGALEIDGAPVPEPYADLAHQDGVWFGPLLVPAGGLFLMGDNRDDSIDSRRFGPVPATAVVGHVRARLWPTPGPV